MYLCAGVRVHCILNELLSHLLAQNAANEINKLHLLKKNH